jgi:ParB/RepB/Spo0J family partition protein
MLSHYQPTRTAPVQCFPRLQLPKLEVLFQDGTSCWLHQTRPDLCVRGVDIDGQRIEVDLREIAPSLDSDLAAAASPDTNSIERKRNAAIADTIVWPHEAAAEAAQHAPANLVEEPPALAVHSLTNPRRRKGLDIDSLNGLAASIKVHGLAQPILVRPLPAARVQDTSGMEPRPVYEVVAGERRWRACQIAGLARMPMLVRDLTDDAVLEMQLVENIEREALGLFHGAEGFELLRAKLGYTVEQIAERIGRGKGASYVYKTLKLCALTPDSREAMYDGTLGRSTGLLVSRYHPEQQAEVVKFIKGLARNGEPLPFRDLQPQLARHFHLVLEEAPWSLDDAQLLPAAGACSSCPKRTHNQGDIFGDASEADSCTDADCFDSKRQAHVGKIRDQAAKDGFKVLDEEETRRAKPYAGIGYMVGYTNVDDTAYTQKGDDGTARQVTFADALRAMGKKAPKPRILIDPHTSQPIKVITRELADDLIPDDDDEDAPRPGRRPVEKEEDTRPPEEQAMDRNDVRRAVLLRMFDAVRSTPRSVAEMQAAALHLYMAAEDKACELDAYLGWDTELEDLDFNEVQSLVKAKVDAMVPEQLDQFIATVSIVLEFNDYDVADTARVALATRYGIDVLAVRDKVAEDLARREAAANAPEEALAPGEHYFIDPGVRAGRDGAPEPDPRGGRPQTMRYLTTDEHENLLASARECDRLSALINNPQTSEFLEAVRLEAAHQRERWGAASDRSKSAENWYWLVGYLAGKCLRAAITGDKQKALHHTISAAAALAQWFDAITRDGSGAGVGQDVDLQAKVPGGGHG